MQTGTEKLTSIWLSLQCRMLSGVNRAVVLLGSPETGPYHPTAYWPEESDTDPEISAAANQAIRERRQIVTRQKRLVDEQGGGNDILACPLLLNGELRGVAVVEITPRPAEKQRAVLQVLSWGASWLEILLGHEALALENRLASLVDIIAASLRQKSFEASATAVVTELANRLSSNRVSIGFVEGPEIRVHAISQTAEIEKKTNLVRGIAAAMQEAIAQDKTISFPSADGTPSLSIAHKHLAEQFGARTVLSIPISHDGETLGALTLEHQDESVFDPDVVTLCESIASLVGPILDGKRREQRSLIAKIRAAFKEQVKKLFGPGHLVLKLMAGAVAALAAVAIFFTGQYRIDAEAVLEGSVQRVITAPFEGYIAQAPIQAGDVVKKGQILCRLDDRELNLEHAKWSGEKAKLTKELREALAGHDRAQTSILRARVAQAEAELALVGEKLARTQVVAPLDGVIVSGDLTQSLGAPVTRGQELYKIAPLNAYRIMLDVDEHDIGGVQPGQDGKLVLAGFPHDVHRFSVERVVPLSTAADGKNFFRVEARLLENADLLRPGMHGVGKIDAGERRLIWIWTHRILDRLRLAIWAW